jgi:hypothetical protein
MPKGFATMIKTIRRVLGFEDTIDADEPARAPFRTVEDLVAETSQLPQIIAAAKSWRKKLENAPTKRRFGMNNDPVVTEKLTPAELDAFEQALVKEFASSKAFTPHAKYFQPGGCEVVMNLGLSARAAGIRDKIDTFGWLSRMRILDDSVDHEIGSYSSYKWENVWSKPAEPTTPAA